MKQTKYTKYFYSDYVDESSSSAQVIRDALIKHIPKTSSVIDIGCGIGTWLKAWQDIGLEIQGIDGDYVDRTHLLIDPKNFMAMDLSFPVLLTKKYDLAESLEVAEHLPENRADAFIEFLCSLSSLVLFAAAIPYQGGTDHINEQWPEFWAEKFLKNGYACVDIIRDEVWTNDKCAYYYAQNTFLYVKHDVLDEYQSLNDAAKRTDIKSLGRVHPKKWIETHERVMRLEDLVEKFPSSICNFFVRLSRKVKQH